VSKSARSIAFTKVRISWSSTRTSASTARSASLNARLPNGQEQFKQINAELAKSWPVITEKKPAPADAKEWEGKPDKTKLLER
jgi:hypothetical protein